MNIFFTNLSVTACAKDHCDIHLRKMIVEYAQMLSTAHHLLDDPAMAEAFLYRKTHENHPCAVWVRESQRNYEWLYKLLVACGHEYEYRFGKVHKTIENCAEALSNVPAKLKGGKWSRPPQCMPDIYRTDDTYSAYKQYLIAKYTEWSTRTDKRKMKINWSKRAVPQWVPTQTQNLFI